MKNCNINELPEEYQELYANKIYSEVIQEKIKYDNQTMVSLIDYFIENEEYEKCKKLKKLN